MSSRALTTARAVAPALLLAAILGAVALLYAKSLPFPFHFDDFTNLVHNPSIRIHSLNPREVLAATGESVELRANRPVAFWTFALNYYFGGLDPWGYRLVNVGVHLAATLLVFLLARGCLGRVGLGGAGPWPALAAAALWALNPVQTSAVVYVVQRMASLASLGYLAALLAYARGRSGRGWPWFGLAAALWALACGTKEIAWILPAGVLLWECAFSPGLRTWLRARPWAIALGLAAGLALFPLVHAHYRGWYADYTFSPQEHWLTELRVVAHYLGLLAWPDPARLMIDYEVPLSTGLLAPPTTLWALGFHAAALGLGAWALVRRPLYGFAVLGYYLHLVVESTVIPLDLAFEHRAYLPSAFLAVGLAGALAEPRWRARAGRVGAAAAVAALLGVAALWGYWTDRRLEAWRTPVSIWEDMLAKQPGHTRAHGNLADIYLEQRDLVAARAHAEAALAGKPRAPFRPRFVLALVEAEEGHWDEALRRLHQLGEDGFHHPAVLYNLGIVYNWKGLTAQALQAFRWTLEIEPRYPNANFLTAELLAREGREEEAVPHLRQELALDPDHADAQHLLGTLTGEGTR